MSSNVHQQREHTYEHSVITICTRGIHNIHIHICVHVFVRMCVCVCVCMDGWMDGWMDGCMDVGM